MHIKRSGNLGALSLPNNVTDPSPRTRERPTFLQAFQHHLLGKKRPLRTSLSRLAGEKFSKPPSFVPTSTLSHLLPKALARNILPLPPDATVPDANPKCWSSAPLMTPATAPLLTPAAARPPPGGPHCPNRAGWRLPRPGLPARRPGEASPTLSPPCIPGSQSLQLAGRSRPDPAARSTVASPVPDSGSAAHPAGLAPQSTAGSEIAVRDAGLSSSASRAASSHSRHLRTPPRLTEPDPRPGPVGSDVTEGRPTSGRARLAPAHYWAWEEGWLAGLLGAGAGRGAAEPGTAGSPGSEGRKGGALIRNLDLGSVVWKRLSVRMWGGAEGSFPRDGRGGGGGRDSNSPRRKEED